MPTKAFNFSGVIAYLSHSFLTQASSVVIIDIFYLGTVDILRNQTVGSYSSQVGI